VSTNPYELPKASLEIGAASVEFLPKRYSFTPGALRLAAWANVYAAVLNLVVAAAYQVTSIGQWPRGVWAVLVLIGVAALFIITGVFTRMLTEKANFSRVNIWLWINFALHAGLSAVALFNLIFPGGGIDFIFKAINILQGAILLICYWRINECPDPLFGLKTPLVMPGLAMGLSLFSYVYTSDLQFTLSSAIAALLSVVAAMLFFRASRSLQRANAMRA
jgi:hypothetical protein